MPIILPQGGFPMVREFTDREYAVIVDSLTHMRDEIRAEGRATPTIDSALPKFFAMADLSGCQFTALTGADVIKFHEAR
jgi:hypothetical protein